MIIDTIKCTDCTVGKRDMSFGYSDVNLWALFAKFAESDCYLRHVSLSVRPSEWKSSALAERIFMKFCISRFCRKSVKKIQVSLKSKKNNGCLREDQNAFMMTFRSFLLRMMG